MKKNLVLILFTLFISKISIGQIKNPVAWSYAAKKTSKTEALVFIKAKLDDGWHIYSTNQKDGGPVKTSFEFKSSSDYKLVGKVIEPAALKKYEESFEIDVFYFEHEVIFRQKVKLNKPETVVSGNFEFMVCNDRQCLPAETIPFSIAIK